MNFRSHFPLWDHYPDLIYLDSAATMQKPRQVIEGIADFYARENANVHRGIYRLAALATKRYENVREQTAEFLGAASAREIVFTKGTTEGINLVAQSYLRPCIQPGEIILVSAMEHHANLLPWQEVCRTSGAQIQVIPLNEQGELDQEAFKDMLTPKVRMLALVHISNTLGTVNPIGEMIQAARAFDIPVLIDAAQSAAHYPLNVQELDCDFLLFSGHKLYGPTGIGVLYGKGSHLEAMQPWQVGGSMIREVDYHQSTYADPPSRFEPGTPNLAGVAGLGHALDFIQRYIKAEERSYLAELGQYTDQKLAALSDVQVLGQARDRSGIFSFICSSVHPHDLATLLDSHQVAVRAGHHCTQPLMKHYGVPASVRVSLAPYNSREDIDAFIRALQETLAFFL